MRKPPYSREAGVAAALLISLWATDAWAADPIPRAPSAADHATDVATPDPATLLLFSVTLDGLTLSEGLGAYGETDDPLVPVSELARLLEADLDVFPAERRIVGRLGEARRALLVDLNSGTARIAAQELHLSRQDSAVTATEIYLRVSALQKLLPLKVEVASDELALKLQARERFPIQARLDRLVRRPDGSQSNLSDQETLKVVQPYAFFTPPGMDVVLDGGLDSGARGGRSRYDIRLAGDLFWTNFQGFLASDDEGRATNARLMFQRQSLEGDLLGPLHARQISAGDTFSPGLPIGPRSVAGRGISFSTAPLDQTNIFNRIDLRGELPPGYDVELYVNDVLRSSTSQAVNGRYEFLNVPLSPGLNVLRTVTFSPRGERQEEVQVVNVGAALLRPGEARLSFGIVDQDQPLIRLRKVNSVFLGDPGVFAARGRRTVAALDFGLTPLVSLTAGVAQVPQIDGGKLGVYSLGGRTSVLGIATQLDLAWDGRGGAGASLALAGQFRRVSAVLRHAEYEDNFVDENNLAFNPRLELTRRSELTLDSSLNLRGRIVPVSMRAIRNEYTDGDYDVLAAARASSSLARVLVSAGLEYQRQDYRTARASDTLTGYVTASTFRGYRWQVRTTFDYMLVPDVRARFLTVTLDRQITDAWSLRFGLGESFDNTDAWNLLASGIYTTRYGDLALTGEYDNSVGDFRLSAQWNFGLSYNPERRGYDLTRTGPGSGGSALFNAFIDENSDGVRQASEPPAPNVGIEGGGRRGLVTDATGRVLVTGLGGGPTALLDVNLDKLDNPSVLTPPTHLQLRPRPGSVARVDFPMRPTGEVMVKVELLRDDGQKVGLSSVRVQLISEHGATVDGMTEFDGSAVFASLPIGVYRLSLETRQAEKLRMRLLQRPIIVVKGDGNFLPDVVVQVRFEPPAQETTIARAGGG